MPDNIILKEVNSEDIHEIITAVPAWILRWGICIIFSVLGGILIFTALIDYPDIVKTSMKVNSLNSPKLVLARQNGKIINLLVHDGDFVKKSQPLAFIESTANPSDVLSFNQQLKKIKLEISNEDRQVSLPDNLYLGELQNAYQTLYQQYSQYQSTQKNGYYLNKLRYLEKDLTDIQSLKSQIIKQKEIQKLEYANQEQEYHAYQKLFKNKVISRSEFLQQENKYLSAKYPLQQNETSVLNNSSSYASKQKELLDLKHIIAEEKSKFNQAISQCISESDKWIRDYIITAPLSGKVTFVGIIQVNQNLNVNQNVFVINPGNSDFFGEIQIPQYNMGKIHLGQHALVKLRSYPYEQYGMIRGRLTYVSDAAYQDSVFVAKISFDHFENKDQTRKIILRNGMQADVEIITEESSLLQRFFRNISKLLS